MRILAGLSIAAMMLFGMGCSSDKSTAPSSDDQLSYDVTGTDAPASFDDGMNELAAASISVPEPVSGDDPAIAREVDSESAATVVERAALDDNGRVNFRRIVAHLHEQMRTLRACMERNDSPELRRLAWGAHQAYNQGMRALENGRPRLALERFRLANRILNLANGMCTGRG